MATEELMRYPFLNSGFLSLRQFKKNRFCSNFPQSTLIHINEQWHKAQLISLCEGSLGQPRANSIFLILTSYGTQFQNYLEADLRSAGGQKSMKIHEGPDFTIIAHYS